MTPPNERKALPEVTLVCVDCYRVGEAVAALQRSLQQIKPFIAFLFTDVKIEVPGVVVITIPSIRSKNEYSRFIIKELYQHIVTDYVLIVQNDGWVLDGSSFNPDFYNYDYIGAKWMYPKGERNVGNGGFSWRSHKLLEAVGTDDFVQITEQEDDLLCRMYGSYLEQKYDIRFAPEEVADQFAYELNEPVQPTFGFHGFFHSPYKPHLVIKRSAAMGDVLMAEPLIQHYHDMGYQVVLDIPEEWMKLFIWHPFPIKHISKLNSNIKPEKVINLDMAYEVQPQKPVLQAYYEIAGIADGAMRNSRLYCNQQPEQRLFERYILLHLDDTGLAHRNQHGINWAFVVSYYERLGYTVLQIGKRMREKVARYFNTMTLEMLMYAIKGADLFIGIDSGNAQISVAMGTKSVLLFGSVNPKLRYQDFSRIEVVQSPCPKSELTHCYHSLVGSTTGAVCAINPEVPPCTSYTEWDIIRASNKLLKNAINS